MQPHRWRSYWGAPRFQLRALLGPPFTEDLDLCAGWVRPENEDPLPLPPRARDTGPSGPGTRRGPRTPLDAEMGVSSGQAGRADRGTLVTNAEQVGEPGQGRQGPQYLEDPRPRLSFGTSHSWALQGSQGRAGGLITCWGIETWLPQAGQGLGGSQPR